MTSAGTCEVGASLVVVRRILDDAQQWGLLGLDLEWCKDGRITWLGIGTAKRASSFWFPSLPQEAVELVKAAFADADLPKLIHNLQADKEVWERETGAPVRGVIEDTMLMHHAAFPGIAHDLQQVVSQFIPVPPWKTWRAQQKKERETNEKDAAKAATKAAKVAAHEARNAERAAERERRKAVKRAEHEAKVAEQQAERERKKLERQAEHDRKNAERKAAHEKPQAAAAPAAGPHAPPIVSAEPPAGSQATSPPGAAPGGQAALSFGSPPPASWPPPKALVSALTGNGKRRLAIMLEDKDGTQHPYVNGRGGAHDEGES